MNIVDSINSWKADCIIESVKITYATNVFMNVHCDDLRVVYRDFKRGYGSDVFKINEPGIVISINGDILTISIKKEKFSHSYRRRSLHNTLNKSLNKR
jgi:hypothetical protein